MPGSKWLKTSKQREEWTVQRNRLSADHNGFLNTEHINNNDLTAVTVFSLTRFPLPHFSTLWCFFSTQHGRVMSWRWSRAWRTCGRSVCPTWSPLQVRAPTSSPQAARGWSTAPWAAARASTCWWVASGLTGILTRFDGGYVSRGVAGSRHTKLSLRLIKPKHTTPPSPLKPNTDTDTDTPGDSLCCATPSTVFHNFIFLQSHDGSGQRGISR